jgi:hypothetical protein
MKPLLSHRHLEEERHIRAALLRSSRFAGRIWTDVPANAIVPHADQDGPCGYEIKNRGFPGFACCRRRKPRLFTAVFDAA